MTRILTNIFLVLLILLTPYWIFVPALLLASLYFPFFIEVIFLAFYIDIISGAHGGEGTFLAYPFGLIFSILILAFIPLREQLRLHA